MNDEPSKEGLKAPRPSSKRSEKVSARLKRLEEESNWNRDLRNRILPEKRASNEMLHL